MYKRQPNDWPATPPSYYDVLTARDADQMELPGGRLARRLPQKAGTCDLFMLPCGSLRCAHGNSESTLSNIAKQPATQHRRRPCDCTLGGRTWRRGR